MEMVLRFLSTYEIVEIKTDVEPSIVETARRVQARRDKTTTLAQTTVGGHQRIGAVERANGTVQAQLRAYYLDVRAGKLDSAWVKAVTVGRVDRSNGAFQTATKRVDMLRYKDCRGTHSKEVQRC